MSTLRAAAAVVLVVDDHADIRETVAATLEEHGFGVMSAADGREALDVLRGPAPKPRLILLDLFMPRMDGWKFRLEQLRDAQLAEIPVVVMSAESQVATLSAQMKVAGFLQKPFGLSALLETARKHCG